MISYLQIWYMRNEFTFNVIYNNHIWFSATNWLFAVSASCDDNSEAWRATNAGFITPSVRA